MNAQLSDLIIIANLALSLAGFALVGRWYLGPWLARQPLARALEVLLLVHGFRHIGLMFLAPGALTAPLPEAFAYPAAFGDLAAAGLAFVAIAALRAGWNQALTLVWVFNIVGSVDLVYAVGTGAATGAASGMGAAFWIPAVLVPALLVTHYYVFRLLWAARSRAPTAGEVDIAPIG